MNTKGSYRKLLNHSKQAMVAALEIYNKPKFEHREEVFSILLVNAWELLFLSILSKNEQRIYEPKKRNQDYKTLNFHESLNKVKIYFPTDIPAQPVIENIQKIRKYRNIATHYYHDEQHKHAIYALACISIKSYRDLCLSIFDQDIADEVSIILLPLSFNAPPDFVEFFKDVVPEKQTPFVRDIISTLETLENEGADTSRFIINYKIKFEPTSNIKSADLIAVKSNTANGNIIERRSNPNDSHPLLRKKIIGSKDTPKHKDLQHGLNSYDFQAVIWKHKIKEDYDYCWVPNESGSPWYTPKIIDFLNSLTSDDISEARAEYGEYQKKKRRK